MAMTQESLCIFCGIRRATSKEHFWPQWLARHVSLATSNSNVTEFYSAEGKQPQQLLRRSVRPGGVHTKKMRVVCPQCNNGWMSELEQQAKTIMLDLFKGDSRVLVEKNALTLAQWAFVKATIGEYATKGTVLTPLGDRLAVYKEKLLPDYTRVFLAYHSLGMATTYVRHSTTVSKSLEGPHPNLPLGISRNIQAITFLVGRICFYVTSVRVSLLSPDVLDPPIPMIRLWPKFALNQKFTSVAPLNLQQINQLSRTLERLISDPRVVYGGPLPQEK